MSADAALFDRDGCQSMSQSAAECLLPNDVRKSRNIGLGRSRFYEKSSSHATAFGFLEKDDGTNTASDARYTSCMLNLFSTSARCSTLKTPNTHTAYTIFLPVEMHDTVTITADFPR